MVHLFEVVSFTLSATNPVFSKTYTNPYGGACRITDINAPLFFETVKLTVDGREIVSNVSAKHLFVTPEEFVISFDETFTIEFERESSDVTASFNFSYYLNALTDSDTPSLPEVPDETPEVTPLEILTDVTTTNITLGYGNSRRIGIKLSRAPQGEQNVLVSGGNLITLNQTLFTFNASNYDTYQYLVVTSNVVSTINTSTLYLTSAGASDKQLNITINYGPDIQLDQLTYISHNSTGKTVKFTGTVCLRRGLYWSSGQQRTIDTVVSSNELFMTPVDFDFNETNYGTPKPFEITVNKKAGSSGVYSVTFIGAGLEQSKIQIQAFD